jgi:hypothetical protein
LVIRLKLAFVTERDQSPALTGWIASKGTGGGPYWFQLVNGTLEPQSIGDDGLYRSSASPGLWLDPAALLQADTRRLRAVVDLGCATADRAAFINRLTAGREGS